MELTHEFTVPAAIDTAWRTFMDLERVGSCFPGAVVTSVTDDGFTGTVKVKLGPIAMQYAGSGKFVERDDTAYRAVIEAKGKDKRGNGTAGATVTILLTEAAGGSGTKVDVATDLAVTGKPAQFGRGVMQDVSDKLLQQFVQCIEGQFADSAAAEPAAAGEAAVAAQAPAESAVAQPPAGGSPVSTAGVADAQAAASPPAAAPTTPASDTPAPATPAPATSAPARTTPAPATPAPANEALDLGSAVIPVLLKTYAPYFGVAAAGVLAGYLFGRRDAS